VANFLGIWVRNGFNIRNQALHYRDFFDFDMFMLQVLAVNVSPDRFFMTLMTRFEVLSWFGAISVDVGDPISNDVNQFASVAEDLLQLIVVLITEKGRVNGVSERAERRRELIHHLALHANGIAFSELGKRVSNRLFDMNEKRRGDSMDDILKEIATFKFPEGSSDRGIYELKDVFYAEVDPWFWHYSRNQREEIEVILAKRGKKKSNSAPLYEFSDCGIEKPYVMECKGAFERLDAIKGSVVLVKMIASALRNVTRGGESDAPLRNDAIFGAALHLCMVSLDSPGFVEAAGGQVFKLGVSGPEVTLVQVLLEVLGRGGEAGFKEFVPRLKFILRAFKGHADVVAWRTRAKTEHESKMSENEDAEGKRVDRRREEAKARRDAIKAKFNTDQEKFQENYEGELEDMGMDKDMGEVKGEGWAYPSGTCIVCQEATDRDGPIYGMLGFIQPSFVMRHVDFTDADSVHGVYSNPQTLDVDIPLNDGDGEKVGKERKASCNSAGLVSSACGHLMHFACFRDYSVSLETRQRQQPTRNHPERLSRKEFLCPLCKSLGNCLLPVLWGEKEEHVNWTGEIEEFGYWMTNRAMPRFEKMEDREDDMLGSEKFASKLSGLVAQLTNNESTGVVTSDLNLMSYCSRLVTVVKIVYKHINPEYRESFVGLNYLDLLWYLWIFNNC
jgi:E3 ubiquitin-protein ligase UBR1